MSNSTFHIRYDVKDSGSFYWREVQALPTLNDIAEFYGISYKVLDVAKTEFNSWLVTVEKISE